MTTARLASDRTVHPRRVGRTSVADCVVGLLLFADCVFWFEVLTALARGAGG